MLYVVKFNQSLRNHDNAHVWDIENCIQTPSPNLCLGWNNRLFDYLTVCFGESANL